MISSKPLYGTHLSKLIQLPKILFQLYLDETIAFKNLSVLHFIFICTFVFYKYAVTIKIDTLSLLFAYCRYYRSVCTK